MPPRIWRKFTLKTDIPSVKSRVKYTGNYREELENIMGMLEEAIEEGMKNHFEISSIIPGNTNLKIRIDDEHGARIVNCIFRFHHNDTKFGNIHIDLISSGLSKKPKIHLVGKFEITDYENICNRVLADLALVGKHLD